MSLGFSVARDECVYWVLIPYSLLRTQHRKRMYEYTRTRITVQSFLDSSSREVVLSVPNNTILCVLSAMHYGKSSPQKRPRRSRGGADIKLYSSFNLGARWGWVVNATLRPLYSPEWPGTHCTGGWVGPRPVWTGAENHAPTGIRSLDRQARQWVAIPTEVSRPTMNYGTHQNMTCNTVAVSWNRKWDIQSPNCLVNRRTLAIGVLGWTAMSIHVKDRGGNVWCCLRGLHLTAAVNIQTDRQG